MKKIMLLGLFFWLFIGLYAIEPKNFVYAQKDTARLTMDVYNNDSIQTKQKPCLIFVFGGGFTKGSKSEKTNAGFCKAMADSGYVVAAIDYRLGMKGVHVKGLRVVKSMNRAINMAVEDLYSATAFLLQNADSFHINPKQIIISGSSAGAVTVLQADYDLSNNMDIAYALPVGFRYAGVISFAGGLLSHEGLPDYKRGAAPTLFFHGEDDKIVNYKSTRIFRLGFFGTNELVKRFKKFDYPYNVYRYSRIGHEVCFYPMIYKLQTINQWIKSTVISGVYQNSDTLMYDPDFKPVYKMKKLDDLY